MITKIIALIIIWTMFAGCVAIMRKISPEDKVYPVYGAFVSVVSTALILIL